MPSLALEVQRGSIPGALKTEELLFIFQMFSITILEGGIDPPPKSRFFTFTGTLDLMMRRATTNHSGSGHGDEGQREPTRVADHDGLADQDAQNSIKHVSSP